MKPFVCCDKCKGKNYDANGNKVAPEGFIWDTETVPYIPILKVCDCKRKYDEENRIEKEYILSGFDQRYFNYNPRTYVGKKSFDNFKRLLNYADKFAENPKIRSLLLYVYGPNGTQKTTVLSFVGKKIISKGFKVKFITMNKLLDCLQEAKWSPEKEFKVQKLDDSDLLIIDESFDKEKMLIYKSGFQISFIDDFMRYRYSQGKGMIFISNKKIDEIAKQGLSESIRDFIDRETKIYNTYITMEDNYLANSGIEYNPNESLF